jgi:hypothetical protein
VIIHSIRNLVSNIYGPQPSQPLDEGADNSEGRSQGELI